MTTPFLALTDEYSAYLHDETKTVGHAETISFPTTEEEICETLKTCSAAGVRVTVQGNRTGLTTASVPYGGHVLSLDRMCGINGMRIGDDGFVYLRVQPGLSLYALRQKLAVSAFDTVGWDDASLTAYKAFQKMPRQMFTPDPTETSASIGGMAACNSSGAKTYHYGATRPYISAVRLALSDGDVLALRRGEVFAKGRDFSLTTEGGRVIAGHLPEYTMPDCKNASGYYVADDMDMLDLIIGSDGTLGVMTELELKLLPQPKVTWGINCFFAQEAQSIDFVEQAKTFGLAALEYFDGHALDILRGYKDGGVPVPEGFDCMVYVEIHAEDDESAMALIRRIGEAMERSGGKCENTWCARSLHDRERLLELRHKVPESVNALIAERKRACPAIAKVGSDMAVPDDKLREVLAMYHRDLEKNGFEYAFWGHIGNNHLHINVLPRNEEDMKGGKAMFAQWAKAIVAMGGTVSAEHGIGKNKRNLLETLYGEQGLREMAAVKALFDPNRILGMGNLFPEEYVK